MNEDQLRQAIDQRAADGKVPCHALLSLAAETHVPPKEIGSLCDRMHLKIAACQLGCFQ